MRHRLRFLFLLLVACTALPGFLPRPAEAAPPTAPPSGWVKAQVVGGGCDAQGRCSSDVRPGSPTLYEYKPDRQPVGRDFDVATDRSQHGGYPTFVEREKCHIGTTDYYWSRGIWHHGGYWTLTYDAQGREVWSGPSREHWAFEHSDVCEPLPTPQPTVTPAPPPPGAPTYTPVPPPPTPVFPTPTEPPPPAPCAARDPTAPESRRHIAILVDGYAIPEHAYAWDSPANSFYAPPSARRPDQAIPPYGLARQRVRPNAPLALGFAFDNLETSVDGYITQFPPDHYGQSAMVIGIRDLTTNQNVLLISPEDLKRDGYDQDAAGGGWSSDGRHAWIERVLASGVTFLPQRSSLYVEQWNKAQDAWVNRSFQPVNNSFIRGLGALWLQFTPEQDHRYAVWTWSARGPCQLERPRWSVLEFTATDRLDEPTAQPTATPSPTPSPTPLPPPPPVPQAAFTISIHSTLDPNSQDGDTRNGVYTSDSARISWPAGEVLDFTPRVRMTLSPPAPAYAGYAFRARVQDWSFVSSVGQNAATKPDGLGRAGCRGGAHQTSGAAGPVCTYRYIGGASLADATEPTEDDMASQAHVYWAHAAPQQMRQDVYVYNLGQLRQVDLALEVRIVVEVVNLASGQVVGSRTDTAAGTFAVTLVVPRSVK